MTTPARDADRSSGQGGSAGAGRGPTPTAAHVVSGHPSPTAVDRAAEESLERLVDAGARAALPMLGRWLDEHSLRRNLREALTLLAPRAPEAGAASFGQSELLAVGGREILAQPMAFADGRPHPHAVVWYLAGPRVDHAGVDAPVDQREWQEIAEAVLARFAPLGVGRVAAFLHGDAAAGGATLRGQRGISPAPYKRWLAAPLAELRRRQPPAHASRIRVTTPSDLGFWPQYSRMYEEFWLASPELRDRIGMERPEDLEEFRRQGGLRLVWIDDRLAGLIGGVRHAELGLRGWRLRERVLGGDFRGAGYATAALDAFLRDLAAEPDELLWGTILPDNLGSLRSALNLGRVDIGGLWWLG